LFTQNTSTSVGGPGQSSISTSSTNIFRFQAGISSGVYKAFQFDNSGLTNNITRTYTMPDASGTLALTSQLSGVIYGSGATYQVAWFNATNSIGGSSNLYFDPTTNRLGINQSSPLYSLDVTGTARITGNAIFGGTLGNGTYTYTLPSATGTLALTSNLSSYVPYSGATGSLYMGSSYLVSAKAFVTSGSGGGAYLKLLNALTAATPESDGVKLSSVGSVDLVISSNTYNSTLVTSGNTADRTYTFPNASGTIALTSNIPTLSGTAPISYSAGVISITQATNASNGYLTSTDWTTFNNKQAALSGTGLVKSTAGSITYITDNSSSWNSGSAIANSLNGVSPINFNSITGAISISQANTSTNGYLSYTDWNTFNGKQNALTNPVTGTGTTNYISKWTASGTIGNTSIYEGTSGYISIGNTNSTYNLDVTGTGRFTGALTLGTTAAPSYGSGSLGVNLGILNIQNVVGVQGSYANNAYYNGTNWIGISASYNPNAVRLIQTGDINFHSAAAVSAGGTLTTWDTTDIKMIIKASGNVGIGTSSPDLLLHVEGQAGQFGSTTGYRTSKFTAKSSVVSDKPGIILGYDTNGGGIIAAATESTGQPINFWTYNGSAWGERMRITSGGNVGIGTSSPSATLSVIGSQLFDGVGATFKRTGVLSGQNWNLGIDNSGISFYDNTNSAYRFIISPSGYVNIGTLGTGTVAATGGTLSTISDMNLKIEDGFIDNALQKVMNLKPRYFHWKEESGLPTNLRQLGFYAQEVNSALGEEAANTPKNENDRWGIYDRGIIAFLTAAIQEQQAQIEAQQQQINSLINK